MFLKSINVLLLTLLVPVMTLAKPIKVMVIDTGVSLEHKEISQHVREEHISTNYFDQHGHGTHIAGLVLKNTCSKVELISCKFYYPYLNHVAKVTECFQLALASNVDVINFSGGGPMSSDIEEYTLKRLSDKGVKIVVAAGNQNNDLSDKYTKYYPAQYKGIKNLIVVGNLNEDGTRAKTSNYGLENMVWEKGQGVLSTMPSPYVYGVMSGTSQATAIRTNKILKELCK